MSDVTDQLCSWCLLHADVDRCRDVGIAIAEHRQGVCADVIVDEHDRVFGLFDKADDLGIGIEYPAIIEDSFDWGQWRADEEVDLVFQSLYLGVLLGYVFFQSDYATVHYIAF